MQNKQVDLETLTRLLARTMECIEMYHELMKSVDATSKEFIGYYHAWQIDRDNFVRLQYEIAILKGAMPPTPQGLKK